PRRHGVRSRRRAHRIAGDARTAPTVTVSGMGQVVAHDALGTFADRGRQRRTLDHLGEAGIAPGLEADDPRGVDLELEVAPHRARAVAEQGALARAEAGGRPEAHLAAAAGIVGVVVAGDESADAVAPRQLVEGRVADDLVFLGESVG